MHSPSDPREPQPTIPTGQSEERQGAARADRVDAGRADSLHFTAPVADWIEFLAELLAAELLRERAGGGSGQ